MMPDAPNGGSNRWLVIGGAALLGIGGILWYRRKQAASGSASTTSGASLGSTPYGPTAGFGSVVPVIINTPSGPTVDTSGSTVTPGGDVVPTSTPTTNPTTVPEPVPAAAPSSSSIGGPPSLVRIPTPPISSAISHAGVPVVTAGHTQYYPQNGLVRISTPKMSSQLSHEGYNVITIGNTQYFNPAQKNLRPR